MARLVLGIFNERDRAEAAIFDLEEAGFSTKDISIIMKDQAEGRSLAEDTGSKVAGGAVTGATTGGVIGGLAGLLIGVGAITVPGIGALLIGGPIAAALGLSGAAATTVSGAVTGGVAGGLLGALMGLGVSEDDAKYYETSIKQGGILVAVPAAIDEESDARRILEHHGANQVRSVSAEERSARMREEELSQPAFYSEVRREPDDERGWFGEKKRSSKTRKKA